MKTSLIPILSAVCAFSNKVTLSKGTTVPHYDATPNHIRHLEQVKKEAQEKRDRKKISS